MDFHRYLVKSFANFVEIPYGRLPRKVVGNSDEFIAKPSLGGTVNGLLVCHKYAQYVHLDPQ
jgi:hypothetical protein